MSIEGVVLIGGHRKSGTTMLHALFDGHPELYAPPHDLNVLYAYYPEWCQGNYTHDEQRKRLETVVLGDWEAAHRRYGQEDSPRWRLFEEHFRMGIDSVNLTRIEDVLAFLVEGLTAAAPAGARHLIIKETSCEMYAPWILQSNPSWRFLQLFRDPRDNYAAIKAGQASYYSAIGNDSIDAISSTILRYKFGCLWRRWNEERFGTDRYMVTTFEQLVGDPAAEMRRIANWIGLSWDEVLCNPTRGGVVFVGNSHEGKVFTTASAAHVGKWHERIDDEEAQVIEFLLGDEMRALGYPRRPDTELDLEAAGRWYSRMNYKYFFADSFRDE